MASWGHAWGTTPTERQLGFPCDRLIAHPDAVYYRGVGIRAAPQLIFRWLCQLRVAPYSYDWIDNRGRQSPRQLIPGLEQLQIGQDVMAIFEVADFSPDSHLTIRSKRNSGALNIFGDIAGSYVIVQQAPNTCRLLVKLLVRYPSGLRGWLMRRLLPWEDLVMMRRQLLNLKSLAEQTAVGA